MEENNQASVQHSVLEQESQGWVYYKELDPIPDNLLGLSICTLDFKAKPRFVLGTLPEDRAFHELIRNPELIKDDFIIQKEEIISFLSSLEEASGGGGTFRVLKVNTPAIRDKKWDLKFLNIYLNPLGNGFIVCNRISRAIRYKEIIPNIDKDLLCWYNSKQEDDKR